MMDEATDVTISSWVEDTKMKLLYFRIYWHRCNSSNPVDYPISMTPEEWAEQFESWIIKEKEKATP